MKASGGVEVAMENELMEYHYIIYQKLIWQRNWKLARRYTDGVFI